MADIICHALSPLFSQSGTAADVPAWYAIGTADDISSGIDYRFQMFAPLITGLL